MDHIKRLIPKLPTDIFACGFFSVMVPVIFLFEVFMVLPTVYHSEKTTGYYFHFAVALFFLSNILGSFFKTLTANNSVMGLVLPSTLKPGWRFCSVCECNAPPRSFHCSSCDVCILKRDHHCFFTGNCIGFGNQRYFVTLLLWLSIAGIYANLFNFDFSWEVLGGLDWKTVVTMLLPLLSWILGFSVTYTFTVAFISALVLIGFLLSLAYLVYQLNLIVKNQTLYEQARHITEYNIGWKANVKSVFGQNWYVAWLSPFIPSPLIEKGTEFVKRTVFENVKDM